MDKVKENKSQKRLRIAMIGHKRIPSREGGIEVVVEELSKGLTKNGCEVTAYNRRGHHVCGKEFDRYSYKKLRYYDDIRIVNIPTINIKGMAAVIYSFFATIAALFGHYDCIHYHGEGPSLMLIIPYIFGIRTVVTIHGLDWMRSKWGGLAAWYLKQGERIAARYACNIIVLSRNIQKYFTDVYHRDTVFIPNGIYRPEIREARLIVKWNLVKDSYILFLGRIVPEKGIQYLIEAFKKVNTDKKLVIAGGASDTDEFMNKIQKMAKDDKRIIFTGFVQGQILEELYSNAYLYILPSDLEGMPLSLLEAMSYSNCCLVSSIPECTEVVEDKAFIFEKGNIASLYMMLQKLCDDPDIVGDYKAKARDFICKKFNWNMVVMETLRLYKQ